jgi:hypothetical protein
MVSWDSKCHSNLERGTKQKKEENDKDKHWGLVNVRFQVVKGKRQNYGPWRRSGLG